MRVLSFSAPSFEQFCQPELHLDNIEKSENKVVLKWGAAKLHSTEKSINLEVRTRIDTSYLKPGHATFFIHWHMQIKRNSVPCIHTVLHSFVLYLP